MRMTGVHRNMGANPRLFVFGYCLVVTVQFGVTSVTACPPETAADSPFTSYSFPPLSSVVEPYENDRPTLVEPAAGTVAFHQVVPEKLRTLDHGRPWSDDQFASTRLSSNRDMSR